MAPLPSAGTSTPPPQVVGIPSSAPVAGSSPTVLVTDAPTASLPKTAAQASAPVESSVGVVYLAIAAPAEALSPSGLAEVRSQLARHLSQFDTRIGDANIALNVLAGSVVLRVALSGDSIDGKRLAKQLETGERKRFAAGDSTLFLVNQRERATAEALGRLIDIQLEYQQALLALDAASIAL
jgi:hypothetical protein